MRMMYIVTVYRFDRISTVIVLLNWKVTSIVIIGRFYTTGHIIRLIIRVMRPVFVLKTYYPFRRTWANIWSSSGYASLA